MRGQIRKERCGDADFRTFRARGGLKMMTSGSAVNEIDELSGWLEASYASAYRTACLILRNPADAEEAVQDAFLRVWRFRASIPVGDGARPWLYRVLVNACCSKLRHDSSRRNHTASTEVPEVASVDPLPETAASDAETADVVRQALAGQPLTVYGDGTQRRVFCHVRDVTQVLAELMERDDVYGEVFNIGGSEEVSIAELAEVVIDLSDSESEVVTVPYDEAYEPGFEDMARRVPSNEKIWKYTGWQPRMSLQDIVCDVVAHHRMIGVAV